MRVCDRMANLFLRAPRGLQSRIRIWIPPQLEMEAERSLFQAEPGNFTYRILTDASQGPLSADTSFPNHGICWRCGISRHLTSIDLCGRNHIDSR